MAESSSSLLRQLEELRSLYGDDTAARRLPLLRKLERRRLASAPEVARLHEMLCFLRAYPDDQEVLARVELSLGRFASRSDLRRHRAELADSGIAGTDIHYRFYWVTASWLARRWPDNLSIDWAELDQGERLLEILDLLVAYAETPGLDLVDYSLRTWIEHLKGPAESDAAFLIRRFQALGADAPLRERLYEQLDVPLRLVPGSNTPSRTRAKLSKARIVFQTEPLARGRPSLRREICRSPNALRSVTATEAREMIDLTREAMATRSRDLDAFAYADERDVRLASFERGLQFAVFGLRPERRLMLETCYGVAADRRAIHSFRTAPDSFLRLAT